MFFTLNLLLYLSPFKSFEDPYSDFTLHFKYPVQVIYMPNPLLLYIYMNKQFKNNPELFFEGKHKCGT